MLDKIIAHIYSAIVNYKEKRLGYRISFGKIPEEYIQSTMVAEMTEIWNRHGLKASGLNYFTLGKIENNMSARFDKDSIMYQSWLGCYLVKFDKHKEFNIQDHINLANSDQIN